MMSTTFKFTELPPELIERVLLLCGDITSWTMVSHALRSVVKDSVRLQYALVQRAALVYSNPNCHSITVSEAYDLLVQRQNSWFELVPRWRKTVSCNFYRGGLYDLADGVLVLGEESREALKYIALPTRESDEVEWRTFRLDDGRRIVDFGLAVHEHDMIVLVQSSTVHSAPHTLEISATICQLSTNGLHPEAKIPRLFLHHTTASTAPGIHLEIVGDYFVLVTSYGLRPRPDNQRDSVYVYQWREGQLVMQIDATAGTYFTVVWISEDVFMLPNAKEQTLELWRIPSSPESTLPSGEPFHVLCLPALSPNATIRHISCRGDPNIMGRSSSTRSDEPFHASAEAAIILFEIALQSPVIDFRGTPLIMIIHRHALRTLSQQDSNIDMDESTEDWRNWSPFLPTAVPWECWGPPITHISMYSRGNQWLTTTGGQRFALTVPGVQSLLTLDFNPETIRRHRNSQIKGSGPGRKVIVPGPVELTFPFFLNPVKSELPVLLLMSEAADYNYNRGLFLDESRIIGMKSSGTLTQSSLESLEILQF